MLKESEIEKLLMDEVRKLGGRAYKWVSPGNNGVPDRIVIFADERPVFVELKTGKGELTALQAMQIKRLKNLGQPVEVVYGREGLIQFFQARGYTGTARNLSRRLFGRS